MKDQIDIKTIKNQAKQIKKNHPELFDYLIRRDEATAELTRTIMDSIPLPEKLPPVRIPFIDLVMKLAEPQESCKICNESDTFWLTPKLQPILCDICRNGIYLRKTGVGTLAD